MSWDKPSPAESLRRAEADGKQLGKAVAQGVALEQASPACPIGKTKSRSGPTIPESDRETEQCKLRLRPGYRARLTALATAEGISMASLVEHWVEQHERVLRSIG